MANFNKPFSNIRQANGFISPVIGGFSDYYPLQDVYSHTGANNGTLNGGSFTKDSMRGLCYSSDGVDDYMSGLNDMSGFSNPSISLWFKADATNSGDDTVFSNEAFSIRPNAAGSAKIIVFDNVNGTGDFTVYDMPTDDQQWHHLVVTWNGSTGNVYYDGSLYTSTPSSTGNTADVFSDGTLGARIVNSSTDAYWKGFTSSLRLYNSILSLSDVETIYTTEVLT